MVSCGVIFWKVCSSGTGRIVGQRKWWFHHMHGGFSDHPTFDPDVSNVKAGTRLFQQEHRTFVIPNWTPPLKKMPLLIYVRHQALKAH